MARRLLGGALLFSSGFVVGVAWMIGIYLLDIDADDDVWAS